MSDTTREAYEARRQRVEDAIALRRPDRVPVAFCHSHYYMSRAAGMTNREAMIDHPRRLTAWRDQTVRFNLDLAIHPIVLPAAQPLAILGAEQFQWPGGALADNVPFQYVEREYLKASEYDAFLANPGDFTVRKLWPRLASGLQPLALLPPLHLFSNIRSLADMLAPLLGSPPFTEMLGRLLELGKASSAFTAEMLSHVAEMEALGFPVAYGSAADAPFDYVADHLRGMRGALLDMYRHPDRLLAATELFTPLTIRNAVLLARNSGVNRVYMPLHRGAAGFMSDEQFARFYWPGLRKVLDGLLEAGLTPMVYFEGEYTPRLKYLAELPPGRVAGHFERVDRGEARKTIGETMCFWGNVPARLLITGTPGEVRDDVKELIDTFASGGLIVDSSMGLPDEARPENVEALLDTVFTYGAG